jgi:hypothetical protein
MKADSDFAEASSHQRLLLLKPNIQIQTANSVPTGRTMTISWLMIN